MRKAISALALLLFASLQVARADVNPNAAPADEYFGPYQQSVLEIRNRLNDYDQLAGSTMLDPSVGGYLDHLQLAIRDWQHKYPRDPWLPPMLAHLMREYWRAGQASSPTGVAALAFMRSSYPDSAYTARTVALVYGSNPDLNEIARDGAEPPAYDAGPSYAPAPAYEQLPSYATEEVPASGIATYDRASPVQAQPVGMAQVSDSTPGYGAPEPYQPAADAASPDDDAPTPPPMR
jgi:hypothetical protein